MLGRQSEPTKPSDNEAVGLIRAGLYRVGPFAVLMLLGMVQLGLVSWLALLSARFAFGSDEQGRPVFLVVAIWSIAFVLNLASLIVALRIPSTRAIAWTVFGFAIAMRSVLLWSEPIQEVDIYRYIWDGAVMSQGINPYEYSPQSITTSIDQNADIKSLTTLLGSEPGLAEIHRRVHYPQFTTVYPPVSQLVFALAYSVTPRSDLAPTYVQTMKLFIIAFDIGTLLLIAGLLRHSRMHLGWLIAYGWSPLVLKEFANSGHLDSIAVFFVLAAMFCAVQSNQVLSTLRFTRLADRQTWSAVLLGLGVGAKLFPIVLAPLLVSYMYSRRGLRYATAWTVIFALTTTAAVLPMLMGHQTHTVQQSGLASFLQYWEINDLLFMLIEENIRPENSIEDQPQAWFAVVPDSVRISIVEYGTYLTKSSEERVPFVATRALTTIAFGVIAIALARINSLSPERLLENALLTIAWFWFLSPTQNPWYWTWALPLVPFARNRAWLLVGGLTMIYYLRFWTEYHVPTVSLFGEEYVGTAVFDFLVVWLEFAPILLLLLFTWFMQRSTKASVGDGASDNGRLEPTIVPAEHEHRKWGDITV